MRRFLLLSILTIAVLTSRCSCCGGDPGTVCTFNDSVKVFNVDNTGLNPVDTSVDTVPAIGFALRLGFVQRMLECKWNFSIGMAGTSYALSCPDPRLVSRDTLDSMAVFSTIAFDAAHPPGTPLNDYFVGKNSTDIFTQIKSNPSSYMYLTKLPEKDISTRFAVALYYRGNKVLRDTGQTVTLTR